MGRGADLGKFILRLQLPGPACLRKTDVDSAALAAGADRGPWVQGLGFQVYERSQMHSTRSRQRDNQQVPNALTQRLSRLLQGHGIH